MLLSKCVVCDSTKSKFVKQQEASGLLTGLGTKAPLSKIPLVGPYLFWRYKQFNTRYKMNEIPNKFLLAGDKFMPETHLRQPRFNYSACGPLTKNKERIQKFKETGDSRYIYQTELHKVCIQHDMAYGDFKDLSRRTASDKILLDKAFNIAKNPICDGYQRRIASMDYKFLKKCSLVGRSETLATRDRSNSGGGIKTENISNKELP